MERESISGKVNSMEKRVVRRWQWLAPKLWKMAIESSQWDCWVHLASLEEGLLGGGCMAPRWRDPSLTAVGCWDFGGRWSWVEPLGRFWEATGDQWPEQPSQLFEHSAAPPSTWGEASLHTVSKIPKESEPGCSLLYSLQRMWGKFISLIST